jgi:hypothetical protein
LFGEEFGFHASNPIPNKNLTSCRFLFGEEFDIHASNPIPNKMDKIEEIVKSSKKERHAC